MTSIVFMGTPQFSVPILTGLVENGYAVKAVVTQPDRPVGRKRVLTASPVKQAAIKFNIPVFQPEKISGSDEMERIINLKPDLIITAAFGQFLPEKLLAAAKVAAINVHGSLLPKYRGGAPVQYAIMNGDAETGISIMDMVKAMDAGDVIAQSSIPIEADDDTASMFKKLSGLGRKMLLATIPKLIDGTATRTPQDPKQVVFSPTIKRSEERLDFNQPARLVDAKVRALRPDPSAFTTIKGKRTKVWQTTPRSETTDLAPGCVVAKTKKQLVVAAGDSTTLQLDVIQPAGKPKQQIKDYLNGAGQSIQVGEQIISND
ncbi:methionyl-tRNA formyltransferase [Nicoliella spurrieriana]|uniref:Methionyl-tRNA formyltransferase n=1 Tax=Nicoliella spurrieriana TaxID=2925830 RepID=A0A976RRS6_9LACO|nr:methionyl-tRNA formyltransferase [Nicoliella spurrieriana]UQS86644.1 methionyl-tRNA formyltransferase [Nicoliella spurrieriana]